MPVFNPTHFFFWSYLHC